MLIMTAKLSKGKLALCLVGAALLLFLVLKLVTGGDEAPTDSPTIPTEVSSNEDRLAYIAGYGYTAQPEPTQTQEVSIPKEFNQVFTRYNELQRTQGLNLEPYAGKHAKRYVYDATDSDGKTAKVTLVVYQDTVIAADVSSTEGRGYMKALLPQTTKDVKMPPASTTPDATMEQSSPSTATQPETNPPTETAPGKETAPAA